MQGDDMQAIFRLSKGRLVSVQRRIVEEFPLKLSINGRELATLVTSPHQLNFLLVGFLQLQGFIADLDEILCLGICQDFGVAEVRLKGEVPERLAPTLTSGCGTGISYNLPATLVASRPEGVQRFPSDAPVRLMQELGRKAESYRSHGGTHSAAVGDQSGLLLYAEDIGRHNTLDRIAGEALFKKVDLQGKMLVISGRVSTEMVAKAARLGIGLIASRTSPTDKAIRLSRETGITLIGYLRGEEMEIYSHPQQLEIPGRQDSIPGISGVILAGGESRRMGCDKSLLPLGGARFIDHSYRRLDALFEEVILVTNTPSLYQHLPCRKVPDLYVGQGALAGIHSGVRHARFERAFVVACDMPFLSPEVIRHICSRPQQAEVVIPRTAKGLEPLHALYHKSCLPAIEAVLDAGDRKIARFFPAVKVTEVTPAELDDIDAEGRSFRNINTPQEYFALCGETRADTAIGETRAGKRIEGCS